MGDEYEPDQQEIDENRMAAGLWPPEHKPDLWDQILEDKWNDKYADREREDD